MNQKLIDLSKRLMEIPTEIESRQTSLLEAMTYSAKIHETISHMESKIRGEINAETDQNGKKVYSNAEVRDAEFIERVALDDELNEEYSKRDSFTYDIQTIKIGIEFLGNEQRNIRTVLAFFTGDTDTTTQF